MERPSYVGVGPRPTRERRARPGGYEAATAGAFDDDETAMDAPPYVGVGPRPTRDRVRMFVAEADGRLGQPALPNEPALPSGREHAGGGAQPRAEAWDAAQRRIETREAPER